LIHHKKRNRLTEDRARDLVYIHSNLRLLKNIQAVNCWNNCWMGTMGCCWFWLWLWI